MASIRADDGNATLSPFHSPDRQWTGLKFCASDRKWLQRPRDRVRRRCSLPFGDNSAILIKDAEWSLLAGIQSYFMGSARWPRLTRDSNRILHPSARPLPHPRRFPAVQYFKNRWESRNRTIEVFQRQPTPRWDAALPSGAGLRWRSRQPWRSEPLDDQLE